MLVTNTTAHCFVLSAGVIIRPNAVDVEVSDATYAADSTLNSQLDALDAGGEVTITGKPADPFSPILQSQSPVTLQAHDSAETPLVVSNVAHNDEDDNANTFEVWADPQNDHGVERMVSVDGNGNLHMYQNNALVGHEWLDENSGIGNTGYTLGGIGFLHLTSLRTNNVPLQIRAADGQTGNLMEVYDEDGFLESWLDNTGQLFLGDLTFSNGGMALYSGGLRIAPPGGMPKVHLDTSASQTLFVLQAVPGQTGNLVEAYDENSDPILTVHADGLIETNDAGLSVDHNGGIDAGFLVLQPSNAAYDILSVQGKPGQTGKLLLVKDGTGATVFRVDADGSVHIKTGTTIHADL